MEKPVHPYTPSELNREARLHLEAGFGRVWVEGEISNFKRAASGHLYFSLKDAQAQISCALFRTDAQKLGFRPADGQQVLARGRLSLYEPRGNFQLIADHLEEAGEGRLRAAYEALKKRLEGEGLFAAEAKQPLPSFPTRIAVVTSPTGAVIRDILHVLDRRWPLAAVRLYPVPVQGEQAAPAIVRALASANRHGWAEALIVARGGGSLEDLWAFNEEAVARAVHASAIPVISAVGHETDFSICDFVADVRAPTPSAAAELLAPDQAQLHQHFRRYGQRLARIVQHRLQHAAQRHDHLAHRLRRQHPEYRLRVFREALQRLRTRLERSGAALLPSRELALRHAAQGLGRAGGRLVPDRRRRLGELARTLQAVSPLPTLNRGYALLMDGEGEHVIASVAELEAGQRIAVQLRDGRVHGTVERLSGERLNGGDE